MVYYSHSETYFLIVLKTWNDCKPYVHGNYYNILRFYLILDIFGAAQNIIALNNFKLLFALLYLQVGGILTMIKAAGLSDCKKFPVHHNYPTTTVSRIQALLMDTGIL